MTFDPFEYAGRYADFSPHGWGAERRESGFRVKLCNSFEFDLPDEPVPVDWYTIYPQDHASTRLWFRSLVWLRWLVSCVGGWEAGRFVLREFAEWYESAEAEPSRLGMNSLDHALALQLRTLCELRAAWVATAGGSFGDEVDALLERCVATVLVHADKPEMKLRNNHGVMLGLALIHVAHVYPGQRGEAQVSKVDIPQVRDALGSIVGADGLAFENTPSYQRLYVDILNQFKQLQEDGIYLGDDGGYFRSLANRVTEAYRHLLMPSGSVPPLGDGCQSVERLFTPLVGPLISEATGLFILSDESHFLAITCGAASPVHKQMDDSALRAGVGDRMLILDGGLLSYDGQDPVATAVRAQPGHSGLFFTDIDSEPPYWFYPATGDRRVDASMRVSRDVKSGTYELSTRYRLADGREANRQFSVRRPDWIEVVNVAFSDRECEAVERYLLPKGLAWTIVSGRVDASDSLHWVSISGEASASWRIQTTTIAARVYQPEEVWLLERSLPLGQLSATTVRFGSR